MTIGQRIAQMRKELGLSQEGLGEKLGVSRQAISKWESDASVPEIDKLIVLSKLFSVSVGWLLGVETPQEQPPETEPASEPESTWQWLRRGISGWKLPAPEDSPTPSRLGRFFRTLTPKRLGILFLILTQLYLCLWVIRAKNLAADAQIQAMIAKSAANSVQAELSTLRNALSVQEETERGVLVSDYTFDITPEPDVLKATVTFSAVPHSWQEGSKGYLCISGRGVEPMELPCQWDGAFFRCAAVVDLSKTVQLCFALEYADGSRQLQLLSVPELENGSYTQPPTVRGSINGILYHPKTQTLTLKELDVTFQRSEISANTAVTWQTQSILLLADGEEAAQFYHFNADTHPHDSSFTSGGGGFYTREKSLNNVILTEGQQVELVVCAELSNGLSAREVIGTWTVSADGTLIPAE